MIVRHGPLTADARGKLGGIVFSRCRAGSVVRIHSKPASPVTGPQSIRRARTTVLFSHWSTQLTDAQRLAWDAIGASTRFKNSLGERYLPSGQATFCRANWLALETDLAIIEAAPTRATLQFPTATLGVAGPPQRLVLSVVMGAPTAAGRLIYQISAPRNPGRTYPPNHYPWRTYNVNAGGLITQALFLRDDAAPISGRRYHARLRYLTTTGIVSNAYVVSYTVP